jgi:hypothetical protein
MPEKVSRSDCQPGEVTNLLELYRLWNLPLKICQARCAWVARGPISPYNFGDPFSAIHFPRRIFRDAFFVIHVP